MARPWYEYMYYLVDIQKIKANMAIIAGICIFLLLLIVVLQGVNYSETSKARKEVQSLSKTVEMERYPKPNKVRTVRNPTEYFTGRAEYLDTLKDAYLEYRNSTQSSKKALLVVVSGVEGCGKTQLVLKYSSQTEDYNDIIWISASSPSKLEMELKRTARLIDLKPLGLQSGEDDDKPFLLDMIVPSLMEHLSTIGQVLLIFDGADKETILTDIFGEHKVPFPRGSHVIITSRYKNWFPQFDVDHQIELGGLDSQMLSVLLFTKVRYGITNDVQAFNKCKSLPEKEQRALDELCGGKVFAGHALAITLVAANLKSSNLTVVEFLKQWGEGDPSWALKTHINESINYVLMSTLHTLSQSQLQLIDLVSLLSHKFREEFLVRAAPSMNSNLGNFLTRESDISDNPTVHTRSRLENLLEKLSGLYIVERATENGDRVLIVHGILKRLHSNHVRRNISRWVSGTNSAIAILNTLFPDYNTTFLHDHYTCRRENMCLQYDTLAVYASSIANEITKLLRSPLFNVSDLVNPIPALSSVSMYLRRHNDYQNAIPIMDAVVNLANGTYTRNSSGLCLFASLLNQLGKLHFHLGNRSEAERLGKSALGLILKHCANKIQVAAGYQVLARAMQYQNVSIMSREKREYIDYLLYEAMRRKRDILRDETPPEMTELRMDNEFRMNLAYHNFAQYRQDLGQYSDARFFLLKAQEIWMKYQNGTTHWKATWLVSIAAAKTTEARNFVLQVKTNPHPYMMWHVWNILERAVEIKGRHLADSNFSHQLGLYYLCRLAHKYPKSIDIIGVSVDKYYIELKRVDTTGKFQRMLNATFVRVSEEFPSDDLVWM